MNIGKYQITNSNPSAVQNSLVRVRLDGVILAEVRIGARSNPLKYIRSYPLSAERKSFVEQLRANQVPQEDIEAILKPVPTDYMAKKLDKAMKKKMGEV